MEKQETINSVQIITLYFRQYNLSLSLSRIGSVSKEEAGFLRSDKIVLKLYPLSPSEAALDRPFKKEKFNFIKISFRTGGHVEFYNHLNSALKDKLWTIVAKNPPKREIRAGITGIEKKLSQKAKQDNANISKAFEDLNKLIEMAKPMVKLAQSISTKIREKQGEITEDETVQFKSYLLSLGIDDPITKGSCSDSEYYKLLAKEMFLILDQPIQQSGGMISLTDAFVRVNRARGMELVSPGILRYLILSKGLFTNYVIIFWRFLDHIHSQSCYHHFLAYHICPHS